MNENTNFTLDQKLKAFELAVKILDMPRHSEKAEDSQGVFNEEMDEFISLHKGFAKLLLREVDSI